MSSFPPPAPSIDSFETQLDDDDLNDIATPAANSSNPSTGVIAGAAAFGAVTGLVLMGPLTAVVAGAGMAVATMTTGTAGDVSRAAGGLGSAIGTKASEVNKQHNVTGKTSKACASTVAGAKSLDAKHDISGKAKAAAITAGTAASDFNQKHQISNKAAKAAAGGMNFLSSKLSKKEDK